MRKRDSVLVKGRMSTLGELHKEISICTRCPALVANRSQLVPGDGAEDASIMFIGEAPGFNEDKQGKPFVGQAGSFLNELLALIGMEREQVYITNVIKCRPPNNRDPLPTEIINCRPWLDTQIALIHPKIIVLLGRYAVESFLPGKSISKIHGTVQRQGDVIYYAMYHPAAALYQESLRSAIKEDMLKIPAVLAAANEVKEVKEEPKQLSMF